MIDKEPYFHAPDLQFEPVGRECWWLTQTSSDGTEACVSLHPIHIRALAQHAGLAPSSDVEATRMIAKLARRIRLLHHRIAQLDDWLQTCSDTRHADLAWEIAYSGGTLALAEEFVADLDDAAQVDSEDTSPSADH